ncbi:MAG: hypothetical protein MJ246_02990 [Clostridia bacterium]|nr:hypothetical protein [Clostridia bacterium]
MYNKMGKNAYKVVNGQIRKGVVVASGIMKDIHEKEDQRYITVEWKKGKEEIFSAKEIGTKVFFSKEAAMASIGK